MTGTTGARIFEIFAGSCVTRFLPKGSPSIRKRAPLVCSAAYSVFPELSKYRVSFISQGLALIAGRARRLRRGSRSRLRACATPTEHKHQHSESQQHDSPVKIDINSERLLVKRRITRRAVNKKNKP